MNELISKLKIAFFPKRCKVCGEVIAFDKDVCTSCACQPLISEPVCLKCGCSKEDCICKKSKRNPEYKAVIAPYYYDGSIKTGVLNFKMNEMPMLAEMQGKIIADTVKKFYKLIDFDFITYIPMLRSDEINREYNQAQLLANIISRECCIPVKSALLKKRKNKMQKRQNAFDRFINMYNVFDVFSNIDFAGKKILLIDDVKTTGATLSSASMTLKAHGAKQVYCAVFAIVK